MSGGQGGSRAGKTHESRVRPCGKTSDRMESCCAVYKCGPATPEEWKGGDGRTLQIFSKKFQKRVDKPWNLWYNKTIKRGTTPIKEDDTMMNLWMNKETGELLTYCEMIAQAREWYDFGDDSNACELEEYYEDTGDPVPEEWLNGGRYDDEPSDIDNDMGFDPYAGAFTWDC